MTTNNNSYTIQVLSLNTNKFYQYMNGGSVRTYTDSDNNHWFVAKDVAEILCYSNTQKAISDHVDDEDKCRLENDRVTIRDSSYNHSDTILINESGTYSLVFAPPDASVFCSAGRKRPIQI